MKYGTLFLSPLILLSLNCFSAEGEKKIAKESYDIELSCMKCNKYILTMNGSFLGKNVFFWESITKPSNMVIGKDASMLLPISALPPINCPECKVLCCEPVWHTSGDRLKAAYKAIAAHNKGK